MRLLRFFRIVKSKNNSVPDDESYMVAILLYSRLYFTYVYMYIAKPLHTI